MLHTVGDGRPPNARPPLSAWVQQPGRHARFKRCVRSLEAEADCGTWISGTSAVLCCGRCGGAPGISCRVWETALQEAAVAPEATAARDTSIRKKCVGGMGSCTCSVHPPPLHQLMPRALVLCHHLDINNLLLLLL